MMHPDKGYHEKHGPRQDRSEVSYRGVSRAAKDIERLQCYKYFLFAYNLLIFICGSVLLGIGIWMAVDRNFITYMVGSDLYAVAIFMILAGGAIIFAISFLGCCGSITENKCLLFVFFIILCIIFLALLIGGILAGVFRAQIGAQVQETMADTLINHYGVNLYERNNRLITDAWDKAQERLDCCAVHTRGWAIYQEALWFQEQSWNPGKTRQARCSSKRSRLLQMEQTVANGAGSGKWSWHSGTSVQMFWCIHGPFNLTNLRMKWIVFLGIYQICGMSMDTLELLCAPVAGGDVDFCSQNDLECFYLFQLQCCSVNSNGWALYRESKWFELYGAVYELTGTSSTDEDQKPYVPKSCCVKDRFWRLINPEVCQKWRLGPPGSPIDGAINRALYYDGCYDAALAYIRENSNVLIGLGISIALLLGVGIFLAFMLIRYMKT